MIYEKWRELNIDPSKIKYKNIIVEKIISYPPAGNDVVECIAKVNEKDENVFIKIERSKVCDFESEVKHLNYLLDNNYYTKLPKVYENGSFDGKNYIILSKIEGERLSDILSKDKENKKGLLYKYGKELAIIHKIPCQTLNIAKQRIINELPEVKIYTLLESEKEIKKYIDYLKENDFEKSYDTFIHGDFHYGNILWVNDEINGVIDWEYSGRGLKEQDIAWAITLRYNQKFMNNKEDINNFLKGYKSIGNYNDKKLKWCLINAYCHFYLMNKDIDYRKNVLKMLSYLN